jgi:tRNA splicing ligase
MDGGVFVVALTAIGCGTAVVLTMIDKLFGGNKEKLKLEDARRELRHALDLNRQQELRIVDLSRQNDQLQKQVEWHGKLLETQDQMLKRLGSGEPSSVR